MLDKNQIIGIVGIVAIGFAWLPSIPRIYDDLYVRAHAPELTAAMLLTIIALILLSKLAEREGE